MGNLRVLDVYRKTRILYSFYCFEDYRKNLVYVVELMLDILNFTNSNFWNLFFIYGFIGRRNHFDGWNDRMREISLFLRRIGESYFFSF